VAAFDADGKNLGVVFETATPFDTPRLMFDLVGWAAKALKAKMLPLIVIGVFMRVLWQFTPFRMAMDVCPRANDAVLLRSGYTYVPYSFARERDRADERALLHRSAPDTGFVLHATPDWLPWLTYFFGRWWNKNADSKERSSVNAFFWEIT